MQKKDMNEIYIALKGRIRKPLCFNGIQLELLDVIRAKHPPERSFPLHHHPWFEFNYFTDGQFLTEMNGKTFLCEKGEALLIPPGAKHTQKSGPLGDDGLCLRFQISAAVAEPSEETFEYLEAMNRPRPEPLHVDLDILQGLGEGAPLDDAVFLHFILSLFAPWKTKTEARTSKQRISHQAILYMEEYLQNQVKAEDIARALNMSYRTLARIFKKETGVTLVEKLNELRLRQAQYLLQETELSISQIAQETGFENIHYFSGTFKKYMRVSPKQFREAFQQEMQSSTS